MTPDAFSYSLTITVGGIVPQLHCHTVLSAVVLPVDNSTAAFNRDQMNDSASLHDRPSATVE